jgi:hypothetical protein
MARIHLLVSLTILSVPFETETDISRFINCVFACVIIWFFVDVKKGRAQAIAYSIQERGLTAEVRTDQVDAVKGDGERVKA